MWTVQEIYDEMARLAPPELAESWDNVGLLVDCGGPVDRVLVALDITPDVVAEAVQRGAQLIVSHHPVIFSPLKRLDGHDVAFQLVHSGVSAICMHTNLDAADGGVNDTLAALFGLRVTIPFAGGCGRIGTVDTITVPQLADKAQQVLGAHINAPAAGQAVQIKYADCGRPVQRLAVVSGAGGSFFEEALALGADCLLTGEANHHHACDAVRLGVSLVAAGHYATEFPVTEVIAERLRDAFAGLEVIVSAENRDPYTYI